MRRISGPGPAPAGLSHVLRRLVPNIRLRYLKILLNKLAERPTTAELQKAFRLFDAGSKGVVRAEDLRRMASDIGEQISDAEIGEMIAEADSTGTGSVNPADFKKIVTSYAQHYDGEK